MAAIVRPRVVTESASEFLELGGAC
jgi:hypothetical protein